MLAIFNLGTPELILLAGCPCFAVVVAGVTLLIIRLTRDQGERDRRPTSRDDSDYPDSRDS